MPQPERSNPDRPAPGDAEVGIHYEDAARADGLASLYEAATPLGEFYRDRMSRVAELLAGVAGDLLDAGCGTGQMLRHLRESRPGDFALAGLDRSASLIDAARRSVDDDPSVRLVVGRIEQMPFEDGRFDVVLAMGSLEYVTSVEQALAEIARVTRPDGLTIVTMQNRWSPYRLWDTTVWSRIRRRRGAVESPVLWRLEKPRLRSALSAAGLTPLSVIDYGYNVFLPPLDSHFPQPEMRLQRRLARIARGPLRRLATDYIAVARRRAANAAGD